jgi:hypothetical protein
MATICVHRLATAGNGWPGEKFDLHVPQQAEGSMLRLE